MHNILQVASLATLALLLAAIGGSDISLQYIFEIYVRRHAPIRSIRRMDCQSDILAGSNIVYVEMTLVYSRAVMQHTTT